MHRRDGHAQHAGSARFAALLAVHESQAQFVLLPGDGLAEAIEQGVQDSNATKTVTVCTQIIRAVSSLSATHGLVNDSWGLKLAQQVAAPTWV